MNGSEFYNTEVKTSTLDEKFDGAQGVVSYDMGFVKASVSGAYYDWMNTTGATETAAKTAGWLSQNSNTNSAALKFWIDDYTADIKAAVMGVGLEGYYEYTYNAQQKLDNTGNLVGFELASGKLIPMDSDWLKIGYNYRDVKKNYTFSGWNFSDFAGGVTDARGGMFYTKIKFLPNAETDFTYFSNVIGLDAIAAGGKGDTYERYQVDLLVKF